MTAKFIVADVMDGLASLETGSVDLVVTSPPFLALRSYLPADHELKSKEIGSESTPAEFIDTMLKVTAELRRVLAPHGSICVELGDTYAGSGGGGGDYLENGWREGQQQFAGSEASMRESNAAHWRQKNKDKNAWPLAKSRTLIPSLYQIALAYGFNPLTGSSSPAGQWRIRNVVTWARPNPPVGALGDKWRPATSDLIIACTSGKRYWDDLATRSSHKSEKDAARTYTKKLTGHRDPRETITLLGGNPSGAPLLDYWEIPEESESPKLRGTTGWAGGGKANDGSDRTKPVFNTGSHEAGAPLLDYWVIPPGGYTGAHYAVFPEELVVPCVQAMCPQRVCVTCGEPSRRIVETEYEGRGSWPAGNGKLGLTRLPERVDLAYSGKTTGWSDCGHDTWRNGLVLDPFAGSGTTLAVATGHGHDAVGIDLDSRNAELARDRVGPFLFEMVDLPV